MLDLFFTIFLLALPTPLAGGGCVHDFADIIPEGIEHTLQQQCDQVESETTAEMAIVTVKSLDGESVDDYANQLFNSWGIGQKETNNGVLILVAPNERRGRIEVGYGLEAVLTDAFCGDVLNSEMIPHFKSNDYPSGIVSGANSIAAMLRQDPQASHGVKSSLPSWLGTPQRQISLVAPITLGAGAIAFFLTLLLRRRKSFPHFIFWPLIIALLGLSAWLVSLFFKGVTLPGNAIPATITSLVATLTSFFSYRRYRPRKCGSCGTIMALMPEDQDDTKLDEGQKLEEKLGSVDYDIWSCPACLTTKREKYDSFGKYKDCEKCKYKTFVQTKRTVVVAATTSSTGLARLNGECKYCKFTKEWTETIARISTSSSSSSSSSGGGGGGGFSGGSSGGGGASGGW